jgi:hypothetical protein
MVGSGAGVAFEAVLKKPTRSAAPAWTRLRRGKRNRSSVNFITEA